MDFARAVCAFCVLPHSVKIFTKVNICFDSEKSRVKWILAVPILDRVDSSRGSGCTALEGAIRRKLEIVWKTDVSTRNCWWYVWTCCESVSVNIFITGHARRMNTIEFRRLIFYMYYNILLEAKSSELNAGRYFLNLLQLLRKTSSGFILTLYWSSPPHTRIYCRKISAHFIHL